MSDTLKLEMNETELVDTIAFAKRTLSKEMLMDIIRNLELKCQRCGKCCTIPAIPKIQKAANVPCNYLAIDAEGKYSCSIYDDFSIRPAGCAQWPVLGSYFFMLEKKLGQITWGYNVCPNIRIFWAVIWEIRKTVNFFGTRL